MWARCACVLVVGLTALLALPVRVASAGTDPTITYYAGPDPGVCSSRPDQRTLTIIVGVAVTLVNRTGATATVDAGGGQQQPRLGDGMAVSVRLGVGAHRIRMVPDCLVSSDVEPAVITVLAGSGSSGPSPTATTPAGTGGPPATAGVITPSSRPLVGPAVGPASGPAGGSSGPVAAAGGPSAASGAGAAGQPGLADAGTEVEFSPPFRAAAPKDRHGTQLVGVVALICIFGVSVGIIRAIRAQRATRALERST